MISIVIPTFNHLDDCLRPCVEGIVKYTADFECIIVANGCTDGTRAYVESLDERFRLIWRDEALGYTKATNLGIKEARGEYVVLLNNDAVLLEQPVDSWVSILKAPFADPKVAISGPFQGFSEAGQEPFIIFFCAMMRRGIFDEIGLLDEVYSPGFEEDVDFSIRCTRAGYRLSQVPVPGTLAADKDLSTGNFPLYHAGRSTFSKLPGTNALLERNRAIIHERYAKKTIAAEVATKDRYHTTLPLTLMAIAHQTRTPNRLFVMDDSENQKDPRNEPLYNHIFALLARKGIVVQWVWCQKKGQVACHQKALELCTEQFIWRVDDDDSPEPDVLEKLMSAMRPDVGAVGGRVLEPGWQPIPESEGSGNIRDISTKANLQWCELSGPREADHLNNTFLFRRCATKGYPSNLSPVGHREETLFTYAMKKAGWKVLIEPSAVTWHLKSAGGGIRTHNHPEWYEQDEAVFRAEVGGDKVCVLDNGIGDHIVFKMLLPELKAKYKELAIAACYPEVFDGEDVKLISIDDAKKMMNIDGQNIYKWGSERNWRGTLLEAFREMHL